MSKLTAAEKSAIEKLGHTLYTADFIEDWLDCEPENVFTNAPAALQQMGVEGFMAAVRCIVKNQEV